MEYFVDEPQFGGKRIKPHLIHVRQKHNEMFSCNANCTGTVAEQFDTHLFSPFIFKSITISTILLQYT
jgi:hypothetical protein